MSERRVRKFARLVGIILAAATCARAPAQPAGGGAGPLPDRVPPAENLVITTLCVNRVPAMCSPEALRSRWPPPRSSGLAYMATQGVLLLVEVTNTGGREAIGYRLRLRFIDPDDRPRWYHESDLPLAAGEAGSYLYSLSAPVDQSTSDRMWRVEAEILKPTTAPQTVTASPNTRQLELFVTEQSFGDTPLRLGTSYTWTPSQPSSGETLYAAATTLFSLAMVAVAAKYHYPEETAAPTTNPAERYPAPFWRATATDYVGAGSALGRLAVSSAEIAIDHKPGAGGRRVVTLRWRNRSMPCQMESGTVTVRNSFDRAVLAIQIPAEITLANPPEGLIAEAEEAAGGTRCVTLVRDFVDKRLVADEWHSEELVLNEPAASRSAGYQIKGGVSLQYGPYDIGFVPSVAQAHASEVPPPLHVAVPRSETIQRPPGAQGDSAIRLTPVPFGDTGRMSAHGLGVFDYAHWYEKPDEAIWYTVSASYAEASVTPGSGGAAPPGETKPGEGEPGVMGALLAIVVNLIAGLLGLMLGSARRVDGSAPSTDKQRLLLRMLLVLGAVLVTAIAVAMAEGALWQAAVAAMLGLLVPLVALAILLVGFGFILRPALGERAHRLIGLGVAVIVAAVVLPGVLRGAGCVPLVGGALVCFGMWYGVGRTVALVPVGGLAGR